MTVLKKDRANSFSLASNLKGNFCIAIIVLENRVIDHKLLHFLEGCVMLFGPCELSVLSGQVP